MKKLIIALSIVLFSIILFGTKTYSNNSIFFSKIYPNELKIDKLCVNDNVLNIKLSKTVSGKIDIIEITSGKVLITNIVLNKDVIEIPINDLKCGGYMIRIMGQDEIMTQKFKK